MQTVSGDSPVTTILSINSSAARSGSTSRDATVQIVDRLLARHSDATVVRRETATDAEFINEAWIGASFTPEDARTADQNERIKTSNALAREVLDADILVIGIAMYNFGLPSTMRAWIDQIARPGVTFRPDPEHTYVGLATGKTAYIVTASGETPVLGEMDFATPYLRHVLGFLGITDVHVIAADMTVSDPDTVTARVTQQIDAILP